MAVALILAAGSGERLGAARPKAFVQLAGRPLVAWSVEALRRAAGIHAIVLALPAGARVPLDVDRVGDVIAVEGGPVRSDSVRRALSAVSAEPASGDDLVLVHDAARPLLSAGLADEVIAALAADPDADAAIAAVPVTDTIKRVDAGGAVSETLPRSELWAVQTPQVFHRAALEKALAVPEQELRRATDDAWLIERQGGKVIVVRASAENLKVTTPFDLHVAELLMAAAGSSSNAPAHGDPA